MQMVQFPGQDFQVSRLGLGCMRLPTVDDRVDEEKAIAMIRQAIDSGVNYIDTAYGYHNGMSEVVVGKALLDGYREKVRLVTKLPVWLVKTHEDMERLLDEQLEKLQTDHLDFYLLHALDRNRFKEMKKLDVYRFFDRVIAKGKIKFPGFSFHDDYDTFTEILNDYDWRLALLQMNLLDTENQATLKGICQAHEKGVAITVMEPLRGGALSKTPANVKALYDAFPVKRTPVEWALRFLYDMPEVTVVLSGMSAPEQVAQNAATFADAQSGCMTREERELIQKVKAAYESRIKTGCTGCSYCQPCPEEVRIPHLLQGYDRALMFDTLDAFDEGYKEARGQGNGADQCVECGACESVCPQHIQIIDLLKEIDQRAV